MSEQEHLFCGILAKDKQMSGKCFQTILVRAPLLIDQELLVVAPTDLRTKNADNFSPQLLQGLCYKPKRKNNNTICVWPWKAKVNTVQASQHRQHALISDFLDLANFECTRRSSISHELDR